jgi:hypothetical protein
MFIASSFTHSTSFSYVKRKVDKHIFTRNDPDLFILLAWGKLGGSKAWTRKLTFRRSERIKNRSNLT